MTRKWIHKAIEKPGSLRKQMRQKYGSKAFTARGTIKVEYLEKAAKEKGKMGQRARLAMTLRKIRK